MQGDSTKVAGRIWGHENDGAKRHGVTQESPAQLRTGQAERREVGGSEECRRGDNGCTPQERGKNTGASPRRPHARSEQCTGIKRARQCQLSNDMAEVDPQLLMTSEGEETDRQFINTKARIKQMEGAREEAMKERSPKARSALSLSVKYIEEHNALHLQCYKWFTCVSSRHSQKCVTLLKLMTELNIFFFYFLTTYFRTIFLKNFKLP